MTTTGNGGRARIRTVDGLRGLAALLVVFDHTVGDAWGLGPWTAQNQRHHRVRPAHGVSALQPVWGYISMKAISQLDPGISTAPHLLLSIGGAVILGAASWRFVEQPAQRWLREHPRFGIRRQLRPRRSELG